MIPSTGRRFINHGSGLRLLVVSRESGNRLYWDHVGIIFPYSLLTTASKANK